MSAALHSHLLFINPQWLRTQQWWRVLTVPSLKHGSLESVAECLIHMASWGTCIKHGSLWLVSLQNIPWLLKIKSLHHWILSLSHTHAHTFFVLTGDHLHLNLSIWAIHSFRNPINHWEVTLCQTQFGMRGTHLKTHKKSREISAWGGGMYTLLWKHKEGSDSAASLV
mgnify:CR=1 FL=1